MSRFHISWGGRGVKGGYECSSKGDNRFSAFYAKMPDGRSIEEWYQCDIKGYDPGGRNWRLGKGQLPKFRFPGDQQWQLYLNLWRLWGLQNSTLLFELKTLAGEHNNLLTDCYAPNDPVSINQARALATILNEWIMGFDPATRSTKPIEL